MQTVAEVLRTAAGIVRQGHCKGTYQDAHGNVCALGAIRKATGRQSERHPAFHAMDAYVQKLYPEYGKHGTHLWNDRDDIEAEDVAQGMEKVAALVEEGVVTANGYV